MSPVVVIFPDRIAYELFYGVKVEWQDFGLTQDTTTQRQDDSYQGTGETPLHNWVSEKWNPPLEPSG